MKLSEFKKVIHTIYGVSGHDFETDRKVFFLYAIYTIGIVFLTPYIFIAYKQGSYLLSLFDFIAVILMALTFLYLRYTRDYEIAAYFGVVLIGSLLLYAIASGGVENTGPLWTYIFPLLLMFLLGLKKGAAGFSAYFIMVLLMFFLPGTPLLLTTYSANFKLRFVTTYLVVFIIALFYEWIRAKTQGKIFSKTEELENALAELKKMGEERILLENKLLAAKKMESIGTLAGGMAHELNNQVTIVNGNTDLLLIALSEDKQLSKKLHSIKAASNRIALLTNQLLSFSRRQILQLDTIDLNELIERNLYSINQALDEDIKLMLALDPAPWNIKADSGLLIQMIIDIVLNARDAMPRGGSLTMQTKNTIMDQSAIKHNPDKKEGEYVCLTLRDTGVGMDHETMQRIFDPFFTTKNVNEGSGLGLSSAYGIVKQHNGWIDVSSEPGKGTTLEIYFPAVKS